MGPDSEAQDPTEQLHLAVHLHAQACLREEHLPEHHPCLLLLLVRHGAWRVGPAVRAAGCCCASGSWGCLERGWVPASAAPHGHTTQPQQQRQY